MPANQEDDAVETVNKERHKLWKWRFICRFFEGLQWLTERIISLLRSLVTAAMFLVVAFIIYNAWETRNTVAVKPFQVPVVMGEKNHKQAGRIIANLLNLHLLEAQNTLQSQLSPKNTLKANQAEGEASQLFRNGLFTESLAKYQKAISLNCNNAVAWANMGILLSTISNDSKVRDHKQAQCALLRATTLNENAGWMRHSLCVAQAKEAKGDLGRFLSYDSSAASSEDDENISECETELNELVADKGCV